MIDCNYIYIGMKKFKHLWLYVLMNFQVNRRSQSLHGAKLMLIAFWKFDCLLAIYVQLFIDSTLKKNMSGAEVWTLFQLVHCNITLGKKTQLLKTSCSQLWIFCFWNIFCAELSKLQNILICMHFMFKIPPQMARAKCFSPNASHILSQNVSSMVLVEQFNFYLITSKHFIPKHLRIIKIFFCTL